MITERTKRLVSTSRASASLARCRFIRSPLLSVFRMGNRAPVAQWLELAAHNRLVAGSSPAERTIDSGTFSGTFGPGKWP